MYQLLIMHEVIILFVIVIDMSSTEQNGEVHNTPIEINTSDAIHTGNQ